MQAKRSLLANKIEEANLSEFLGMLSHELRNPLAPVRNAVQALKLIEDKNSRIVWITGLLERQVHYLSSVLDDLLDWSRISSGQLVLSIQGAQLGELVQRAVERARPCLEEHRLSLKLEVGKNGYVRGDPARLTQIVALLLEDAAARVSTKTTIWLRSGIEEGFGVVGIFAGEPMSAGEYSAQKEEASTGYAAMGIDFRVQLARALAELHAGQLDIFESGPTTRFTVHLPLAEADFIESEVSSPAIAENELAKAQRSILVIDDNVDAAASLGLLLRLDGHAVYVAHDGVTAIAAAERYRPEIVFLDIGMPSMDGYEVARELRRLSGMEHALLIAVTGFDREEDRTRSLAAGIDRHLIKPLEPSGLYDLLRQR